MFLGGVGKPANGEEMKTNRGAQDQAPGAARWQHTTLLPKYTQGSCKMRSLNPSLCLMETERNTHEEHVRLMKTLKIDIKERVEKIRVAPQQQGEYSLAPFPRKSESVLQL